MNYEGVKPVEVPGNPMAQMPHIIGARYLVFVQAAESFDGIIEMYFNKELRLCPVVTHPWTSAGLRPICWWPTFNTLEHRVGDSFESIVRPESNL